MEGKGRRGPGKEKQMDAKFLIKASWPRTNYEACRYAVRYTTYRLDRNENRQVLTVSVKLPPSTVKIVR